MFGCDRYSPLIEIQKINIPALKILFEFFYCFFEQVSQDQYQVDTICFRESSGIGVPRPMSHDGFLCNHGNTRRKSLDAIVGLC